MRKLFLLAGAGMMLALGAPAAADAKPGKGKGAKAQVNQRGHVDANRNGIADWRERQRMDVNRNGIPDWRERFIDRDRNGIDDRRQRFIDVNRNGIDDRRERFVDRNGDGIDDRRQGFSMGNKWGGAACPPGLAKKNPPCIPPGQVGRGRFDGGFDVGQRFPGGFNSIRFSRIPERIRDDFDLDDDDLFFIRNGRLFVVDRETRLIEQIIQLGF